MLGRGRGGACVLADGFGRVECDFRRADREAAEGISGLRPQTAKPVPHGGALCLCGFHDHRVRWLLLVVGGERVVLRFVSERYNGTAGPNF